MTRTIAQRLFAALAILFIGTSAWADYRLNLQDQHSELGKTIYDLHSIITWICVWIFVVVFGFMLVSLIKHRKSVGHKAAQFHENTVVEILWTVIPVIILVVMAIPATKALLAQRDTSAPDLTVKVTGYQWKWHYDYLQEGVGFFSNLSTSRDQIEGKAPKGEHYLLEVDNPMVVPIGKKVRVLLTAGDVLHAWYVPSLAVKQDAIPGFIKDTWFKASDPGEYRGQCAELCGKEHGFMPIVVKAVPEEDYRRWIGEQKAKHAPAEQTAAAAPAGASAASAGDGKAVYEKTCQMCHATGLANAPKFGDKAAWGSRVAQGNAVLYEHATKGFKTMPPKGGNLDLADADIRAAVDHMVQAAK